MLRYGYFSDLRSGPKLLMWGEPPDMHRLAATLGAMADAQSSFAFADLRDSLSVDGSTILLERVEADAGFWRDRCEPQRFYWQVDGESWRMFADLVQRLAECSPEQPGHRYLESLADNEITVMVSCGEYPDAMMPDL